MLSLPVDFGATSSSDLHDVDGISKFMTASKTTNGSSAAARQAPSGVPDAGERARAASRAESISRTYGIAEFTARQSVDTTSVGDLQARLLQEMKEKGELMSRYEDLSSQHMSLQKEVTEARARTGSQTTLTSAAPAPVVAPAPAQGTDARARSLSTTASVPVSAVDTVGGTSELAPFRGHALAPSIAPSVHNAVQTVDEVFREEMNRCAQSIHAWIIGGWSKEDLDFKKAAQKSKEGDANAAHADTAHDGPSSASNLDRNSRRDVLAEIANIVGPNYKTIASHSKIAFLQSLVAARLMEIFEDNFFFGIPSLDDGTDLASLRQSNRLLEATVDDGITAADANAWRAHTALLLRKLAESSKPLRTHTEQLIFGLSSSIDAMLISVSTAEPSNARQEQLRAIVTRVIELARLFRAQMAVFKFELPSCAKAEVPYNKEIMTDGSEDGPISVVRRIELATWPGVYRLGDETNARNASKTVVCKAKVVLESGD